MHRLMLIASLSRRAALTVRWPSDNDPIASDLQLRARARCGAQRSTTKAQLPGSVRERVHARPGDRRAEAGAGEAEDA